ncbi:nickel insertion protein [Egicoccus sp. AB-alg2]|uniref:nickel insertion protein n=1 Tax=Egicoccus sp. AB-alg2 TaxID=3242693 RepID=UPI00359E87F0
MRIAHLLCDDGITAELWLGALVHAGAEVAALQDVVARAGVAARIVATPVCAREVTAVEVVVDDRGHDSRDRLSTAAAMHGAVDGAKLPPRADERAHDLVDALVHAEAAVHGVPVDDVHLHELGRPRAVARILAGVTALEELDVEDVTTSLVALGGGVIDIAHGRFPVPPPVVLPLLQGFPVRGDDREVELTTPSGAAVLAALARPAPRIPAMLLERYGRGALRAPAGTAAGTAAGGAAGTAAGTAAGGAAGTAAGTAAAGHPVGDRLLTVLVGTPTDQAAGIGQDQP